MSYFIRSGNIFQVASEEAINLEKKLPPGNYTMGFNEMKDQYFLEIIDLFKIPARLYGDTVKNTDRILNTFAERSGSTGVLLEGEKGSGKTLLAKNISHEAMKRGIPTIVLNQPYHGDVFNKFLQDIEQPCVVLFDEFEKVYGPEQQEAVLTLFDGVFSGNKLFLVTCNDKWRINEHMRNRPGRIYYMLEFGGLEVPFIEEYCEENLNDKNHIKKICNLSSMFDKFNFDMLKALVEEMNRYNETPQEVLRMLNVKVSEANNTKFNVQLFIDGEEISNNKKYEVDKSWSGNPLSMSVCIDWGKQPSCNFEETECFLPSDLKTLDSYSGKYTFINHKGNKVIITKEKPSAFDYYAIL